MSRANHSSNESRVMAKSAAVADRVETAEAKDSAPQSQPELHDVLRQLYRCVRNKKRVDAMCEETKRLNRTSAEALDTFKLMERFVQDPESMLTFSSSLVSPLAASQPLAAQSDLDLSPRSSSSSSWTSSSIWSSRAAVTR